MALTVNTPGGQMPITNGVDFTVDGETGEDKGLAILDKPETDPTARWVAYFAPGQWYAVIVTP